MAVSIVVAEIKRLGPHQRNTTGRPLRREPVLHVRTSNGETYCFIRSLPEEKECRILRSVTVSKRSEVVRSSRNPEQLIERFEVRIVDGATLFGKKGGSLQNPRSQIVRFHRRLNPRSGWHINFGALPAEFQREQRVRNVAPKKAPRLLIPQGSLPADNGSTSQHRRAL